MDNINKTDYDLIRALVAWNKDKLSFTVSDVHKEFNKNKSIIIWSDGEVEDTTLREGLPKEVNYKKGDKI